MITRFRVQNYKALRDVTLELTPMHLLIGPNDSGKTSILEALAVLCRSVDHDLSAAFTGPWSGTSLVWQNADEPVVSFEIQLNSDEPQLTYKLGVRFAPDGRTLKVASEEAGVPSDSRQTNLPHEGHPRSAIYRVVHHGELLGQDMDLVLAVYRSLASVHLYRWIPEHLALPVAPDSNRRFRMEPSGFGLALCLDDILGYDRNRFIELEGRFKSIFPQIESIKLIAESAYKAPVDDPKQVVMLQKSDGKGLYFQFKNSSQPISASQVSDGALLVLAYLAILYLPDPPQVLLVEEPENGIHPMRLEQVLTILRELVSEQSHTQVVLTSHSPYVVSMFQPDEVTLCHKRDDGAVEVRRLSESDMVHKQMSFFTLGEIWTGEGDDALMDPVTTADEAS